MKACLTSPLHDHLNLVTRFWFYNLCLFFFSLSAHFSGPYMIMEKLSDTDYEVNTPERKLRTRVSHINMLKNTMLG